MMASTQEKVKSEKSDASFSREGGMPSSPLEQHRLVPLPSGDGHGEQQRRQAELGDEQHLGQGGAGMHESGAEHGEGAQPPQRVYGGRVAPQSWNAPLRVAQGEPGREASTST